MSFFSQKNPKNKPIFNSPPATIWLCGILIAAHILYLILPIELQNETFQNFSFIPLLFLSQFAEGGPGIVSERMLQLVTYVFLHADLMHILINLGLLLAFGSLIERTAGVSKFIIIFFASAIGGALAMTWWVGPSPISMIGASGAVYGLIGAATRFLFVHEVGARQHGTLIFVAVIMGLNILIALMGWGGLVHATQIAWQAHVGGFIFGLVLSQILIR